MPSVYEYHHVELDKVGKGKRVLKPPGGGCSDIFGGGAQSPSSENGSGSTTPTGRRSSDFGYNTKDRLFGGSPNGSSPNGDALGSPARRASIDRMKSNIFSGNDQTDSPKTNSAKKYGKVTPRRNPITGEFDEIKEEKANGHKMNGNSTANGNGTAKGNGTANGQNGHGQEKLPPVQQTNGGRVRKPPGGESSGIF